MDKQLFIIGNGFDLYHGLNTTYKNFYKYLKTKNNKVFTLTASICFDQYDETDRLWCEFEDELSSFDYNTITIPLDEYNDKGEIAELTSMSSIEKVINIWKNKLDKEFKSWIITNEQDLSPCGRLFNQNAIFFNFNYTFTLQKLYGVQNNQILYIHNNINDDNLIYGHGTTFEFSELLDAYGLLEDGDIVCGTEDQLRDVLVIQKIGSKFQKKVTDIIAANSDFEKNLHNIQSVIVLGHSLNEIDMDYFKWIFRNIDSNSQWYFSYYKRKDRKRIKKACNEMAISKYKIMKIKKLIKKFTISSR